MQYCSILRIIPTPVDENPPASCHCFIGSLHSVVPSVVTVALLKQGLQVRVHTLKVQNLPASDLTGLKDSPRTSEMIGRNAKEGPHHFNNPILFARWRGLFVPAFRAPPVPNLSPEGSSSLSLWWSCRIGGRLFLLE